MADVLNKAGITTQRVAVKLCGIPLGTRIPTVSELQESCGASRGNVQKALAALKDSGAVTLEAHGQNGTLLTAVDYLSLADACGRRHLVGTMPLPYTRRYEGLATALYTLFNEGGMRSFITFLRGSEARVQMLFDGSTDYVVMSQMALEEYIRAGCDLEVALTCGSFSYVGRHVLLVADAARTDWSGARVGIDESSVDQSSLTRRYFADEQVDYVPVQYTHIVNMLLAGELDVGIWNEDDVHMKTSGLATRPLSDLGAQDSNTRAVVVVRADDPFSRQLIRSLASAEKIEDIQRQVMEGRLAARY
ncbi:GntR family transcriptional regulator YhfZ [Olsenella sp. Marseille-P4559]|uniref:GntR family transcriptional regulator YhfZ n=1 Tax=Olsenella sp. Marseille-P4559 TaxID=2364795 RepID=UPI0010308D81|nr:GntR family transcriptional regulator YhfZ [Olsenella sp. Marseille-P4559]